MALTDIRIRAAKPRAVVYFLSDGGGLRLRIPPSGMRSWQIRCLWVGKEQILSLGPYPAVTLADARTAREVAKALLRDGKNPVAEKQRRRATSAFTLESVAREWYAKRSAGWVPHHAADILGSLEREVFPVLGGLPITEIDPPRVLDVLRGIEARGAFEIAKKVRQRLSAVFVYAIATGIGRADPAAIVRGALAVAASRNQPAVLTLAEAREVLAAAEGIPAHPATRLALRLLALTAVRPGEIRGAEWSEFTGAEWRIPAERMKMNRPHTVPLSRQAVEILDAIRPLTGRGPLVFPSAWRSDRPLSENAIGYLLNRAGYHGRQTAHGWRATFSTVMNERRPAERLVIDAMLAHVRGDGVEAAYNRAAYMPLRAEIAQEWANLLLDGMPSAAEIARGKRR